MRHSPRGELLSVFGEISTPTLAVELYLKWYNLYLVHPDNTIEKITFPDEGDLEKHDDLDGASAIDHVPNPAFVERFCKEKNYYINDITREIIVGRWEIDKKENYFNEI